MLTARTGMRKHDNIQLPSFLEFSACVPELDRKIQTAEHKVERKTGQDIELNRAK
jgi:hypothetical protein